jgi:hypothetical protein
VGVTTGRVFDLNHGTGAVSAFASENGIALALV